MGIQDENSNVRARSLRFDDSPSSSANHVAAVGATEALGRYLAMAPAVRQYAKVIIKLGTTDGRTPPPLPRQLLVFFMEQKSVGGSQPQAHKYFLVTNITQATENILFL
jgi:hypothetical protein